MHEIWCQEKNFAQVLIFTNDILFNLPNKGFDLPFGNRWNTIANQFNWFSMYW